jgi:CheY-specific phosphatase CheX
MSAATDGRLAEVTIDTLEKLAFMFASPLEAPPEVAEPDLVTVRVEFGGEFAGGMEVSLSGPVLAELAANMLGEMDGEPLAPDAQLDALKELANVVCGNMLPALGGDAAEFNIQAPCAVPADRPAWHDCAAQCCLALDNGLCRVRMRVEADAVAAAADGAGPGSAAQR